MRAEHDAQWDAVLELIELVFTIVIGPALSVTHHMSGKGNSLDGPMAGDTDLQSGGPGHKSGHRLACARFSEAQLDSDTQLPVALLRTPGCRAYDADLELFRDTSL